MWHLHLHHANSDTTKCGFSSIDAIVRYLRSFSAHLAELPLREAKERKLGRRLPPSYHEAGEAEEPESLPQAVEYREMLLALRMSRFNDLTDAEIAELRAIARRRSTEEARSTAINNQIANALSHGERGGTANFDDVEFAWRVDEDECSKCEWYRRNPDRVL